MADEDLNKDSTEVMQNLTVSLKDTVDAIRSSMDVQNYLANKIAETMDDSTRNKFIDISTRPGMSRAERRVETKSLMLNHIGSLSSSNRSFTILNSHFQKTNNLLQKLVTLTDALHNSIASVAKRVGDSGVKTTTQSRKETAKEKEARELKRDSFWSRKVNRAVSKNPFLRNMMPARYMSMARNVAGVGDLFNFVGRRTGGKLGSQLVSLGGKVGGIGARGVGASAAGLSVGASTMGMLASGGILAALLALQATIKLLITGLGRYRDAIVNAYKVEQRTGVYTNAREQMGLYQRMTLMGYKYDEAMQKHLEYVGVGVTDAESIAQGAASEKLFGLSGIPQLFQQLQRRTDEMSVSGGNLSKTFLTFREIVRSTGLAMGEVKDGVDAFMSGIRGGGFNVNQTSLIMANYADLLKTNNVKLSDLVSMYGATQTMDTNKLLTYTWFAQQGGWNRGLSLEAASYAARHRAGGDLQDAALMRQAANRELYRQLAGKSSWAQLTTEEKFRVSERIQPEAFGFDLAKITPEKVDELMAKVDAGVAFKDLPESLKKEIEEARKTDVEKITNKLDLLTNPVEVIKNLLISIGAGHWSIAKNYAKDIFNNIQDDTLAKYKTKDDVTQTVNISVSKNDPDLVVEASVVPGLNGEIIQDKTRARLI